MKRVLVSAALFAMVFLGFLGGISGIQKETKEKQTESLKMAISRGIAHCYATEGQYPESLEYLEEHYGISYDPEIYFVDYQVIGKNIFPDVTVIEK